jgi:hypothetical protein
MVKQGSRVTYGVIVFNVSGGAGSPALGPVHQTRIPDDFESYPAWPVRSCSFSRCWEPIDGQESRGTHGVIAFDMSGRSRFVGAGIRKRTRIAHDVQIRQVWPLCPVAITTLDYHVGSPRWITTLDHHVGSPRWITAVGSISFAETFEREMPEVYEIMIETDDTHPATATLQANGDRWLIDSKVIGGRIASAW